MKRDLSPDLGSSEVSCSQTTSSTETNNNGQAMERDLLPNLGSSEVSCNQTTSSTETNNNGQTMERDLSPDLRSRRCHSLQTKRIRERNKVDCSRILHTLRNKFSQSHSDNSAEEVKCNLLPCSSSTTKGSEPVQTDHIELNIESNLSPDSSLIRRKSFATQAETHNATIECAMDTQSDNKLEVLANRVKRFAKKNHYLVFDFELSPSGNLGQESMTIDEISGSEPSESTELLETFTSDIPCQPEIEINWNVEDSSPMNPEYNITPTNSQFSYIESSPSGDLDQELMTIDEFSETETSECAELLETFTSDIPCQPEIEVNWDVEDSPPMNPEYNIIPTNSQFSYIESSRSPSVDLDQELMTTNENEISVTDTSDISELLEMLTSDIPRQPEMEFNWNVEDSPMNPENKIISTSSREITEKNCSIHIEAVSSQMDNSPSKENEENGLSIIDPVLSQEIEDCEQSQSTPIEDKDEINYPSSDEDTPFSPTKTRKKKLDENCIASKFQSVANRCRSQRIIWEYQLRSAQVALDASDWPVFIVKELFSQFNCTFMKCSRDAIETENDHDFSLPKSFNILCNNDLSNMREPGEKFKIHLPLLILEHKYEIYLLGGNRLESVESQLSSIEKPKALLDQSLISTEEEIENASISSSMLDQSSIDGGLEFEEDNFESKDSNLFDDCDLEMTEKNVIKIKDVADFNIHEGLGLIRLGSMIRFFVSNPLIIGKFVGWAELPISISLTTGMRGDYLLVLSDSAQHICAFALSMKDFSKWKSLCRNDDDMTNKKYKLTGFKFTHSLPIQMLPRLTTYKPEEPVVFKSSAVYFISPNSSCQFTFEQID